MNLPSVKGLRQFLDSSSSAIGCEGKATLRDAASARSPWNCASNTSRGSRSCCAGRRRRTSWRFSGSTARLHPDPAPDRAPLLVGLLPAVDLRQGARPRQCELDGAFRAVCGRRRHPRAIHRASFRFHHGPFARAGPGGRTFLERCVTTPEDVGYFFPRGEDIFGIKVRGAASIRKFLATRRALRAIRGFNLTHMNRGRNAYQASHCYSLADLMLGD